MIMVRSLTPPPPPLVVLLVVLVPFARAGILGASSMVSADQPASRSWALIPVVVSFAPKAST